MTGQQEPLPGEETPTAAQLFDLLWNTLSDLLGSAATATLLRRSKKALALRKPELENLLITREGLEYRYVLPEEWNHQSHETLSTMCAVIDEIRPLLVELTGAVVLRRLDEVAVFGKCGIVFNRGVE